jgi:TRAP-type C4-dicarboxylate transport system substrate-binding protein
MIPSAFHLNILLAVTMATVFLVAVGARPATAKGSTIELKFAHHLPPGIDVAKDFEAWAKLVEEKTEGKVTVTLYPAESLTKAMDCYASTRKGICDISFGAYTNEPSQFPLGSIMELPIVDWPSYEVVTRIKHALYQKFPEFRAEFKHVQLLWDWSALSRTVHTKKKLIKVPADMKGMKMIGPGEMTRVIKVLGGSPVFLLPPDWYMSLERGVVEGCVEPYNVLFVHKVVELLPYHTDVNLGLLGFHVIMNKKKWNNLPSSVQQIMTELRPWATQACIDTQRNEIAKAKKACEGFGHNFYAPTQTEMKLWLDSVTPALEAWVKEIDAKGLPATEVFKEIRRLIKDYGK